MTTRIRLLGRFEVALDGERVEDRLPGRQGPLVIAVLALERQRPVSRDELIGVLWPDRPPAAPEDALNVVLSKIRQTVGRDVLSGRRELSLTLPADAEIDVEHALAAAARARVALGAGDPSEAWAAASTALNITADRFLPGHDGPWVHDRRAELEDERLRALETHAQAGLALGSHIDGAERSARELIREAPLRESGHRLLMEALAVRGEVAEALAAYEQLRVLLRDELGIVPSETARRLHERLLSGEAPARPQTRAPRRLPDRLAQSLTSAWVGRHATLRRLRETADLVVTGETELVLVTGEGGVGKTRLVAELAQRMPEFEVLYGRCDEEELFPFGPWIDMLQPRLAAMDQGELSDLVRTGPELARLLPEIHDRLPDLDGASVGDDPEAQRRQLFTAVVSLVRRLASHGPVLMVIDDLHWADRSSLILARHLAGQPRLGPVMMVGTFRDTELEPGHPLPDLIADVERDRPVPRVPLSGMGESEVAALIGSWHGEAVEQDAVRAIRAETGGNPFFVKQLVRHLEEAGAGARLGALDGLGVPAGVRDVIARRVARLPARAGEILRVAALIGRDFEYELLQRVADVPADELLDILDAAVRGALLAEVPSTPGRYSFAHALLRSTMEAELSVTRRAVLHRRIGEAIEERHRDRLEPRLDALARHFAEAGPQEVDRAVGYAVRAAAQATDRLAYHEAARLLHRAVALRGQDDPVDHAELGRLESALATAESGAGQWEAARASFGRAAEAARVAEAGAAFAYAALGHSGGTWEQYGRDDAASRALLQEALDRLAEGDSVLRSQVLARLAVLLYYDRSASWEQVLDAADDAVAIARRLGDADALVAALAAAQDARWQPGRQGERLCIIDELIELAEERGAFVEAAEAHLCRAVALLELCEPDEAELHLARYSELAERVQPFQLVFIRIALRAMRKLLIGDYEAGAAAIAEVLERGRRAQPYGSAPMPALLQTHAIETLALLNERDELGRLTPLMEQMVRDITALPGWRAALAWTHVQADRRDLARAELAAISANGFAVFPRDAHLLASLALVAHAVGELGDATLAERAEPLLAPFRELWVVFGLGAVTLGPVAYSLGLLQLVQDRPDDAAETFELAIELSLRMGARPYVARSRAGLADALRRRGAPADEARAEELTALAAADARELGMTRLQRELGAAVSVR